jgi:apolipoprotein N-acyltransferase
MYPLGVTGSSISLRNRLLLGAFSGGLFALAHPPASLWPLVFVAPLPLLLVIRPDGEGEGRRNLLVGAVAGMAFFLPALFWVTHVMRVFGGLPAIVSWLLWLVFAAIFAVDFAAMCWALGRALRFGPAVGLALFPLLFAAQEALRSWAWTGFPWVLSSQALVARPELLWPSTVLGGLFLSALVAAVPAALVVGAREMGKRGSAVAFGVLLAVALLFATGIVRYRLVRQAGRPRPATIRVAVVQSNVPQGERWDFDAREKILRDLFEQTRALAPAGPELIVWSESALPVDIDDDPRVRGEVSRLAGELHASILLNTIRTESDGRYFNSARVVAPDGSISFAYDKRHLVPFGEYVPAKWIFGWAGKIVRGIGDFSPSDEVRPLPVGFRHEGEEMEALVAVAVCYEAVFPDVFVDGAREGAVLAASLTNDAWYGGLGAEEQHWNGAVAAAVASGRGLVRAAVTGISGIVTSDGEVLARIPYAKKGAVVAELPLRDDPTLAVRTGNLFRLAAALASLCAILPWERFRRILRPKGPESEAESPGTPSKGQ